MAWDKLFGLGDFGGKPVDVADWQIADLKSSSSVVKGKLYHATSDGRLLLGLSNNSFVEYRPDVHPTKETWEGKVAACWGDGNPMTAYAAFQGHTALRPVDLSAVDLAIPFTVRVPTTVSKLQWFGMSTLANAYYVKLVSVRHDDDGYGAPPRLMPDSELLPQTTISMINLQWGQLSLGGAKTLHPSGRYVLVVGSDSTYNYGCISSVGVRMTPNRPHTEPFALMGSNIPGVGQWNGDVLWGLPRAFAITKWADELSPAPPGSQWGSYSAPFFMLT